MAQEEQRAVLLVGAEEPVEPEQHGEEGRDPDDPRREARQLDLVGSDGEGDDHAHHDKEQHQRQRVATRARGEAQIADQNGVEDLHAGDPRVSVALAPAIS